LPFLGCEGNGHPQIGRPIGPGFSAKRKFKGFWHHADDRVWLTIQLDRTAKDAVVRAILALPEAVTQDNNGMARLVFFLRIGAAH
jgi:hypothetical protein